MRITREVSIFLYKFKIFRRIIPSLIKKIIKLYDKPFTIINHNNIKLNLNLNNPIDREIYLTKKYEEKNILLLKKLIKKNNIEYFFDVGAHMGFYSTNLAAYFPNILIRSFEPITNNYNQLKSNIDLNDFSRNVKIHKKALSNKTKRIKMWVPIKSKTGGFSIYNNKDKELKKYDMKKVSYEFSKSIRLDDICKIKNKKIAIKIDVERHEQFVIEGGKKIFKDNQIILQVELFDDVKKNTELMLKKMKFSFLKSNGKDYFYSNYQI